VSKWFVVTCRLCVITIASRFQPDLACRALSTMPVLVSAGLTPAGLLEPLQYKAKERR
jgi:hypothetical protein